LLGGPYRYHHSQVAVGLETMHRTTEVTIFQLLVYRQTFLEPLEVMLGFPEGKHVPSSIFHEPDAVLIHFHPY